MKIFWQVKVFCSCSGKSKNQITHPLFHILYERCSWLLVFGVIAKQSWCSTMGVGRQSRRVCFGAKPDKGFLDKKISPYPEVVRGREQELVAGAQERELVAGDQERQLVVGQERKSWWLDPRMRVGSWTGERRVGGWTRE